MDVLKVDMENCVKTDTIVTLENKFYNFATRDMVTDLRDDINDKASKEEIQIALNEN